MSSKLSTRKSAIDRMIDRMFDDPLGGGWHKNIAEMQNSLFHNDPFNGMWTNVKSSLVSSPTWPVQHGDTVSVSVDVPGIPKEKLTVSYLDGYLTISGKTDTRQVSYSCPMPEIDESTLDGTCENGVLTVTAKVLTPEPETNETPEDRSIKVSIK